MSTPVRGRPRSVAVRARIIRAAFALLAELGYAAMSIEAIAARAEVSKATIYKWWPNRADVAIDAFFEMTRTEIALATAGRADDDFRRQIHALADLLRKRSGQAFAALIVGARNDETIARAVVERWIVPRRRWGVERMKLAIERGECPRDLDIDAALSLLYSALYGPLLLGAGVPKPDRLDASLDLAFRGIFTGA